MERGAALGRYLVLDTIGRGGMGVVYAAYDPELDRRVALKVVRPDRTDDDGPARLLREAQAMARLSHPNVVAVHDVGAVGEQVFIALELGGGQTLDAWLTERDHPSREVLDVFVAAGRGLEAAHAAGIVHRDFKPANVLVDLPRVRVTDFGLASSPGASADGGTPAYMAPEVHQGQPSDARADQFSFCVALYEGLTGERPFAGGAESGLPSSVAVGIEIVQGRARPPGRAMPRGLWRVLARGLSRSPADRFPSMGALLDELERRSRRPRRLAGALTVALAVALAVVAVALPRRTTSAGPSCASAAETRLETAWNPPRAGRAADAIAALGLPFGPASWTQTARALDEYASSWRTQRTETCAATRDGQQSAEVLDLRMECLDQRLRELDALAGLFEQPDAKLVTRGATTVGGLGALADCADVPALREPLRRPTDPTARGPIDAAYGELAHARALMAAGDYPGALAIARTVAASPAAAGYPPLLADALYDRGNLETKTGDDHAADATLRDALVAADAGHDDLARVRTLANLVWVAGARLQESELGHWFAREALSAAARAGHGGDDDLLRADVLYAEASVFDIEKKEDDALAENAKVLAIREKAYPDGHLALAEVLLNIGAELIGAHRSAEAEAPLRRALAIYEAKLGHIHPMTAKVISNLGGVAYEADRFDDALALYRDSLAIKQQLLGADSPELAAPLTNLASIALERDKPDEALADDERATALWEKAYGPNHPPLAHSLTGAGQALVALGRPAEAVAPLERALALRELKGEDKSGLALTRFTLAKAIAGTDRLRAVALAAQAHDYYPAGSDERGEVDTWLAALR